MAAVTAAQPFPHLASVRAFRRPALVGALDEASLWGLPSPEYEAQMLLRLVGTDRETVANVRELVAVPPRIEAFLRAYARAHPEEGKGISKVLEFRRRVGREIERLLAERAQLLEQPTFGVPQMGKCPLKVHSRRDVPEKWGRAWVHGPSWQLSTTVGELAHSFGDSHRDKI